MQHPFRTSHDFAPHSVRFNGRIKEGSLQTQDQIRWARPKFETTLSRVAKRIRFDANLVHRLQAVNN